ncbi:signal transduction histidine kinase [Anaerovibrio sp. JC8]|uniref:response regulator n=1 Tax=Anaerovibrio sp. JC8 TaxID=1240085 RepID=UPI000A0BFEA9|nr:response regulator [Anaerovibrio sp. JC8]ORU00631.1 signal transduction histidine kinase [Anaerovibrio sp. JC8]
MLQKKYTIFKDVSAPEEKWEELLQILHEIQSQFKKAKGRSLYLHLLFHGIPIIIAQKIRNAIGQLLPQAVVTGMVETIFTQKKENRYLLINANIFFNADIKLFSLDDMLEDYIKLGQQLGEQIAGMADVKAAAVYCSCLHTDFSLLLNKMTEKNREVVFFGASAGVFESSAEMPETEQNLFLLDMNNIQEQQFIIGDRVYKHGLVIAVFSGKELCVHGDYILGWKPIGKELTVTETVSVNCVARLNDMPATEVYRHYLNVIPDENFVYNISEFPLVIERNGCLIARVPPVHDNEGRIYFNGDIYRGEKARLTYAVHSELLKETDEASKKLCGFGPEGAFMSVCGNRTLFLRGAAEKEVEYYRRFAPELIVNYGTSEIYSYKGQGGVLNSALIAVAFREGPYREMSSCNKHLMEEEPHFIIPLATRMASFLDAVTQELAESNEELKKMAKAAETANKAKSDFLSNMSHEIRTPINAVLGMDEMILRECREPVIREYAENIKTAGNNLLGLINDILDFSKIEAGKLELIPIEYATSSLLNDLVNMIATRAEQKKLELRVKAPEDLPSTLYGDELRLRQVITNILTNAVKYTEQGSVTLALDWERYSGQEIILKVSVTDTGIGIKDEDIAKLFEVFERIEEKRNRTIEGTGLGMNITQKLLGLMDSKLEVESVYGQGSTFSFKIRQKVLNWDKMGNYEEAYRRIQQQTNDCECFSAPEARVLVVDDTVMNLTVVKGLLKRTQIQVDTAASGYECLKMVKDTAYDIIFMDHRMPGMDGLETLAELKKMTDSPNAKTPVVALTANAVAGANEVYRKAGFDDYLTKPIATQKLEKCLLRFLPEDKVSLKSEAAGDVTEAAGAMIPEWLKNVPGIDVSAGIEHCGSVEGYLTALTVFAESLPATADEIQGYFEAQDCNNYTTKVHALKSTARVAGFGELSDRARRLEDAGNSGYINEILTDTPVLLKLCRECAALLAPLLEKAGADDEEKAPISPEELAEAWSSLREVVQSFDDDSLKYILDELSGYELPAKDAELLQAVKKAAAKLDWDKIGECLNN